MKRCFFLYAVLALSACATPEQLEAQRQQQMQNDLDACAGYGFRPGSDAFRNCLMQLDIARKQPRCYETSPRFHYGFYHYY